MSQERRGRVARTETQEVEQESRFKKPVIASTQGLSKEERTAFLDGTKLFHDTFKHLTTLSTGSVLLILTFYEKFRALQGRAFAASALVGFILSTLGSVAMMMFLAKDLAVMGKPTPYDLFFRYGSRATAAVFVLSVLLLSIFAVVNLSLPS